MSAFRITGDTSAPAGKKGSRPHASGGRSFQSGPSGPPVAHRLRIKFSRGEDLKYTSHLDLMRLWERALRRARMPLAYSEGFSPHPRLSIAAPLALGITSEAELMDIFLERRIPPPLFFKAVPPQLPPAVALLEVQAMASAVPSLQSQVRHAEYRVEVATDKDEAAILGSLDSLLAKESLPWQHARDTGVRHYDLRTLVDDVWLIRLGAGTCVLGLRVRLDSHGAGRPEQVVAALGFTSRSVSIHRTRLVLASGEAKDVR